MVPTTLIRTALLFCLICCISATSDAAEGEGSRRQLHTFGWDSSNFLLDGKPFQIISGEMHYPRVPRAYWRDRLKKARAMGLNTICTYVFWDLHEPTPGHFRFDGDLDLAAFVRTAQEEGLYVIVRPGPYICTEWDFGGFPAWLLADPETKVRGMDPRYLAAAERYLMRVGRELHPLLVKHGGPILMTQVENEYGSFGSDHEYMRWVRDTLVKAGFDDTLYTSDGSSPDMLSGGTLEGVLATVNFGGGPQQEFENLVKFRQNEPRMCGEFWAGWFDHWGSDHQTASIEGAAADLDWMLSNGISANIYMFHGGTSFGFMAGANDGGKGYEPDTTSYDYDAALSEAGRPTAKYDAFRAVISRHLPANTSLPEPPAPVPAITIPSFTLDESASLFSMLGRPVHAERPRPMEELGQSYGLILYRTRVEATAPAPLTPYDLRDYGLIYLDGQPVGTLDRRLGESALNIEAKQPGTLDILVENMGRLNYGPRLVGERKGITAKMTLGDRELTGWEIYPLKLDHLEDLRFERSEVRAPAFHRGHFQVDAVGDTFLDMRGWGKGYVWVNGHNLGRFWHIGPQQTLYLPGCWLRPGDNEVIVLDLELSSGARSLQGLKDPVYERKP